MPFLFFFSFLGGASHVPGPLAPDVVAVPQGKPTTWNPDGKPAAWEPQGKPLSWNVQD